MEVSRVQWRLAPLEAQGILTVRAEDEDIVQYRNVLPTFTPGGKAIEFYVSVDIRLRRGDWLIEGKGENKRIVGQVIKFKTHKNKTYKQQQTGEFDFYFDNAEGHKIGEIDNFKEIIIAGIEYGIIERAGSWMRYKGENLAQGADNTIAFLKNNLDKFNQIKEELFKIVELDIK